MCDKNFVSLCCVLHLVTSSSEFQQIFTNNKEKGYNLTIRNKVDTNKIDEDSTTIYNDEITYDLYEKLTISKRYEMQNEFRINSTNNDRENVDSILYKLSSHSDHNHEDNDKIPIDFHTNKTNVNRRKNFTSQEDDENLLEKNDSMSNEVFENSSKNSNESNIVPHEMCHNITCILLCCPLGNRLTMNDGKCISEEIEYTFPNVYGYTNDLMQSENKRVDELFQLAVYDSCQKKARFIFGDGHQSEYKIFANGSIYLSYYKIFVKSTSYCLAIFLERGDDKFEVSVCSETVDEIKKSLVWSTEVHSIFVAKIIASFRVMSILFLVPIFLVYSILPELRNVHGFMLRNYCAGLSVAYALHIVNIIKGTTEIFYPICISIAFFGYFCFMSSYFWLSAMSFNMWRTFRGFYSLQRNVRQPERRKLIYYVIFVYGCPFILAIICVIMDFVSLYVPKILRPQFRLGYCWFYDDKTFALYFYGLQSVCIISSVCLSIFTALKIKRYDKDTSLRLTDSESKRYNDNKAWSVF